MPMAAVTIQRPPSISSSIYDDIPLLERQVVDEKLLQEICAIMAKLQNCQRFPQIPPNSPPSTPIEEFDIFENLGEDPNVSDDETFPGSSFPGVPPPSPAPSECLDRLPSPPQTASSTPTTTVSCQQWLKKPKKWLHKAKRNLSPTRSRPAEMSDSSSQSEKTPPCWQTLKRSFTDRKFAFRGAPLEKDCNRFSV